MERWKCDILELDVEVCRDFFAISNICEKDRILEAMVFDCCPYFLPYLSHVNSIG